MVRRRRWRWLRRLRRLVLGYLSAGCALTVYRAAALLPDGERRQ